MPTYSSDTTKWGPISMGPGNAYVEGSVAPAIEIFSGCPIKVDVAADGFLYLKMKRTESKSRWHFKSEEIAELAGSQLRHLVWYDFHSYPKYVPGQAINHKYVYMTGLSHTFTLARDEKHNEDMYHQDASGAWCGEAASSPNPCVGGGAEILDSYLYIAIHGYFNSGTARNSGYFTFSWLPNAEVTIQPAQLQFLQDLYYGTCYPTQRHAPLFDLKSATTLNRHWNRADYIAGAYATGKNKNNDYLYRHIYSTNGSEVDFDTVPYCDWMLARGVNTTAGTWSDPVAGRVACSDFDSVSCDLQGNIEELLLDSHALRGPLPPSISALTSLKKLHLRNNQLSGSVPATVFASSSLEEIKLSHNAFSGELPCMSHTEPRLKVMALDSNYFTGELKPCLFTGAPALAELHLSYNRLDGAIPSEIMLATELRDFMARQAGLHGTLPLQMMCMRKLFQLDLAFNQLNGSLPMVITNGWGELYSLNLDSNRMDGPLPVFDEHTPNLRYLRLRDNQFSGSFSVQLSGFKNEQVSTSGSGLHIDGNRFSGPAGGRGSFLYKVLVDAHSVSTFSATRNQLLCDPVTRQWPDWVFRFGTASFGECTQLARPANTSALVLTQYLDVYGSDFLPSPELRCKVGSAVYPASYVTAHHILCGPIYEQPNATSAVATSEAGAEYEVSVANYGEDFYSVELAGSTFQQVTVLLPAPPKAITQDGAALKKSEESGTGTVVIVITSVVAVCCVFLIIVLVVRERKGTPIFRPIISEQQGAVVKVDSINVEIVSTSHS